jgi:hypothetical protein
MSDPVDAPDQTDPAARIQHPLPAEAVAAQPAGQPSEQQMGSPAPAGAREVALAVCPYLASAGGSWRMVMPSRDHRCRGLNPPAPQTTEKQRRHCLSLDHVDCAIYRAAREARLTTLAAGMDPRHVVETDALRRPLPRTAPILLERPRLIDQAARLQFDRTPGQVALIALMAVAFAIVALSRLSAAPGGGPASPDPSALAVASSPPATTAPISIVEPSASPTIEPSPSSSLGYRTTYTVKKGDTLIGVANKFKTTAAAIRSLNHLSSSTLKVGQVLKIP